MYVASKGHGIIRAACCSSICWAFAPEGLPLEVRNHPSANLIGGSLENSSSRAAAHLVRLVCMALAAELKRQWPRAQAVIQITVMAFCAISNVHESLLSFSPLHARFAMLKPFRLTTTIVLYTFSVSE